jgi:hypothetical protein
MPRSVCIGLLSFMVTASTLYLFHLTTIDREAGEMALLLQPTISLAGLQNLFSGMASLPLFDPTHPRWSEIFGGQLGIPSPFLLASHLLFLGFFIGLCARLWRQGDGRLMALATVLVVCPLVLTCWLPGPPASRHAYLPSAGFALFIAGCIPPFKKELKKSFLVMFFLTGFILIQVVGDWSVGMELARTTRQRERLTDALAKELSSIPPGKEVILDGLPPRARVEMSLPFLFPGQAFVSTTPSPLLKAQPLESLRENPPGEDKTVVLIFDSTAKILRTSVSELLVLSEGP